MPNPSANVAKRTEIPAGFVPIKSVAETFNTSRSTLDRRRLKAQKQSDEPTLKQFIVRTRDGEIHERPTREQVSEFIKAGRVPEWFVNAQWLKKEYGRRDEGEGTARASSPDTQPSSSAEAPALATLRQQYEQQISDLKDQLKSEKEEKRELMSYAREDKQMFASAVANLSRVVALPGVAQAVQLAEARLNDTPIDEAANAKSQPQPEGDSPTKAAKPSKKTKPKKKPKQRAWKRWFRSAS